MNELEESIVSILKEFGGESSIFLITNPESPWGKLADADTLTAAVKSLHAQGVVVFNEADESVTVA